MIIKKIKAFWIVKQKQKIGIILIRYYMRNAMLMLFIIVLAIGWAVFFTCMSVVFFFVILIIYIYIYMRVCVYIQRKKEIRRNRK